MPEVRFLVRWPDGSLEACYSPSRVVKDYLGEGRTYALQDFLARSRMALAAASERVRQLYGAPCSRALGQLARLEAQGRTFEELTDAHVTVLALAEANSFRD